MAADLQVPLITDVKCAKMLIEAMRLAPRNANNWIAPIDSAVDSVSSKRLIRLPALIDVHVHVRDPGHTHKEDWNSATAEALAGGLTTILAMPNTNPGLVDPDSLEVVRKVAKEGARCDYGLFGGGTDSNSDVSEIYGDTALSPPSGDSPVYLLQCDAGRI